MNIQYNTTAQGKGYITEELIVINSNVLTKCSSLPTYESTESKADGKDLMAAHSPFFQVRTTLYMKYYTEQSVLPSLIFYY